MIEMFEGRPGAGKTLCLVMELAAIRRRNPKKRIFTNFQFGKFDAEGNLIEPWSEIIHTWAEFGRLQDAVVAIDESSLWCPAEHNATLPRAQRVMLKQHRKSGLDVWLTDQSYEHTAKVVRDMVARVFRIRRAGPFIFCEGRDPISMEKWGVKRFHVDKRYFNVYRTDEVIGDGNTGEGYGVTGARKWSRNREESQLITLGERKVFRLEKRIFDNRIWNPVRYLLQGDQQLPELRREGWMTT